jgi:MFS family permease
LLAGYFLYGIVSRRIPVYMLAWGAWMLDCVSYPVLLLLHDSHSAMILEVLNSIIGAVYGVCLYTLAARLCPKGLEGVVYGLMMSAIALSTNLSEKIGAWLYEAYGPQNHFTLLHGWRWSCYFGFGFTVVAIVFIPFLPKWTRSRKLIGDLTDEDVSPGSAAYT